MKTVSILLSLMLISSVVFADDITYSDKKPQIQRGQGVILCPVEISIVKNSDGIEQYKYKTVKVRDIGQAITQDRAAWIEDNKKLMSEYLYGDVWAVINQILDGHGADIKTSGDAKLTDAKKPVPVVEKK